jgi:hypothetical protein
VLDNAMQPVPVGVPGELYIGGAGVTRGYFQRDDLTAERFLPNLFAEGRMYRTGDLARWRPDGRLDFLGRADFQVKLRGYRVELGEIESVIDRHETVQQSVVVAREDTPGVVQLVGYLLADGKVDETALRKEMLQSLPDYMVPRHFVTLDAFPLTPNKKIDRKALPAPTVGQAPAAPAPVVAPTAPAAPVDLGSEAEISDRIAAIWSATLGVPQIGAKDSFFDLGGHSLLAVQVHREIRATMGVQKLSITDIFRAPTLGALAKIVAQKVGAKPTPPQPAPETPPPAAGAAQSTGDPLQDAMARRREMRERRRNR